jgi:hypothetical protein
MILVLGIVVVLRMVAVSTDIVAISLTNQGEDASASIPSAQDRDSSYPIL